MSRTVDWGRYKWQLRLDNHWQDYEDQEDLVVKQAYERGQNVVRYDTRGQTYEVSFKSFTQLNLETKKVRKIRHKNVLDPKSGGKGKGKGKGGAKPAAAPAVKKMEDGKPKPEPKKGCCPACSGVCCCKCCIALPIIGAIAILIIGEGDFMDGLADAGDLAMDAADAIAEGAEDFGDWAADAAGDAVDAAGELIHDAS